jgi:hypothetical protein
MLEFPEIKDKDKLSTYILHFSCEEYMRGYDAGFLDYPAKQLEKKYGETIGIEKLEDDTYAIYLWFNDMVGWACSYAVEFKPKNNTNIDDLVLEFNRFMDSSGNDILKKFGDVKYPDDSIEEELDVYFSANYEIVQELEASIEKFIKERSEC